MMTLVTGLMKLVGSFTSIMADAPVTDAVIAMVPGFVAQSRVGNQPALLLLRKHFPLAAPPSTTSLAPISNRRTCPYGSFGSCLRCRPRPRRGDRYHL